MSSGMADKPRLPPGQTLVEGFPVLHVGLVPGFDRNSWTFRMFGLVEKEIDLKYDDFVRLPHAAVKADFHCVTRWSRFDNLWEGVRSETILSLVKTRPEAGFVTIHCDGGYTTNLPLHEFLDESVLFARRLDGSELAPEHGFPVRLVVPSLYGWKSAKWVRGVELTAEDKKGFWESRGYHNHGDPWLEERYSLPR